MNAILKMRPADPDDEPFLRALRAEIDSERLLLHTWQENQSSDQKKLLDLQFRAHAKHHREADWDKKDVIIEVDGTPVGRFILMQDAHEIVLADIGIARAFRGRGIAHAVLDGIKSEAFQSKRPIRLHVDRHNPALRFYLSQGFRTISSDELNHLMEWTPTSMPGPTQYFFGTP